MTTSGDKIGTDADRMAADIRRYWEAQHDTLGAMLPLSDARTTDFREHPVWVGVIDGLTRSRPGGRPVTRVADMGSGLGNVSEILVRLGFEVIAIDFSAARSAKAAERLARYDKAEVRLGDVMNPPIDAGEVDAVVSRNLVWLLPDPVAAVKTWSNLVGEGGLVSAVESTHRTDRHRFERAQKMLRMLPPGGNASGPTPVTRNSGTPLSSVADMAVPEAIWRDAGLRDIEIGDLGWVTAARTQNWPWHKRILRRDSYFAISGIS
ncbi:SAM-dependent methyltransferase [Rhodococcus sp. 27YEA15]|uniref:class I SAM-dependent methyltransferase n=1 Tax=Rhodococcus sp. 27YEA15 TaxID=3156259 RepID=UPI003C7B97C4